MCNDRNSKTCYFDVNRQIMVHIFKIHSCLCVCGKKVVRQPVKEDWFLFGKKLTGDGK